MFIERTFEMWQHKFITSETVYKSQQAWKKTGVTTSFIKNLISEIFF